MSQQNVPFSINYLDKRITDKALRAGLMTRQELNATLAALPDHQADSETLEVNQGEELEKRATRRERIQNTKRMVRARERAHAEEFVPNVPTPKPNILDEE